LQTFLPATTNGISVIVRAGSAQAVSLQEWRNSGGTVMANVSAGGSLITQSGRLIAGGAQGSGRLDVQSSSATQVGATIRAAASQTADLQQWQNSAGTVLSYMSNLGGLYSPIIRAFGTNATIVPMQVTGAASQSANLQEWRNSAGSILAQVGSDGSITGAAVGSTGAAALLQAGNGGGSLRLNRATSAGTVTANQARISIIAGTTGSKLVIVGPSGTVYTILDNIT
jgi:hypothetical protein